MNPTATTRLRTPEEIALDAGAPTERLLVPEAGVFAERALRLRQLAAGHAMRDYLLLMAQVGELQHERLAIYPAVPLPGAEDVAGALRAAAPPLDALARPRDAAWRAELRALMAALAARLPAESAARAAAERVQAMADDALEQQAERLLAGVMLGLDLATAPFIAAGLQLYYTHLVRATAAALPGALRADGEHARCPCCGAPPTAAITRLGADRDGRRFVHCALCNAEWHMVRVKCTHCMSTAGIHYRALERVDAPGGDAAPRVAVQAETCDACHHYLKIMHMDRDVHVEPVADDLATLTLDLLVAGEGFARHGVNFLLLFGDGDGEGERDADVGTPAPPGSA